MSKLNDLITKLCPDGVPYRKLGEVSRVFGGYAFKSKEYTISGARVMRISDVQAGYISNENAKYCPIDQPKQADSARLLANDLLVSLTGNVGRVAMVDDTVLPAYLNQRVAGIRTTDAINHRFLFHYLNQHQFIVDCERAGKGSAQKNLSMGYLTNYEIPLPPLPVQSEVVRILDAFTELEAELEAELADRIEQYEYFRARLFDDKNLERMDGGKIEHDTVNSLVDVITPTAKIKKNEYKEAGLFPVIDQGMNTVIAGYTDNANALPDNEWILFGDHTCSLKYFDGRFVQGADGLKILKAHDNVLPKFVFYALKNLNVSSNEYARHWTSFKKNELPVPSLATQERIVDILDRFDTLTTSLTKGIPAEIAMRREQYEYYRSKLLDFPRLSDDSDSDGNGE